jgi:hypothetical protein
MDAQEQQHALKGRQKLEEVRRKKAAAAAAGSGQVLTTPFFLVFTRPNYGMNIIGTRTY